MKYRSIPGTELNVSEVGFGMWTVSTGWWGNYTDPDAMALMRKGYQLGITLFDAADTYGNGRSEELIGKAFSPGERDELVLATKIGYDFVNHGDERRGQREIPQDFSPENLRQATEAALRRLRTDRIDILQLHNIRMEQVEDDAIWTTLDDLQQEGKVLCSGVALGPAIGWLYEGVEAIKRRQPAVMQHIYNMLEQHPGQTIQNTAQEVDAPTMFLVRVPHSSGILEGKYREDTVFPPNDHRNHRPRSWLLNGIKKVEQLRFLENADRTLGQAALRWLLNDPRTLSTLPNIYDAEQLTEFAQTSECPALSEDDLRQIGELYAQKFGMEEEPPKYKGTMERPEEVAA